jgi:predicted FMN-binding regulatory protein PaiB
MTPLGIGHVARANVIWRELGSDISSVVMFQGLQAYVTPGGIETDAAGDRDSMHVWLCKLVVTV